MGTDRYGRLAEAAVLLREGNVHEARQALASWRRAAEQSEDPEYVRAGNHWAVELLDAGLGPTPAG